MHNCMHDIAEWRLQLLDASWQVNDFHFDAFAPCSDSPVFLPSWTHKLELPFFFPQPFLMCHLIWMVIWGWDKFFFTSNVQGTVQWTCLENEGMSQSRDIHLIFILSPSQERDQPTVAKFQAEDKTTWLMVMSPYICWFVYMPDLYRINEKAKGGGGAILNESVIKTSSSSVKWGGLLVPLKSSLDLFHHWVSLVKMFWKCQNPVIRLFKLILPAFYS